MPHPSPAHRRLSPKPPSGHAVFDLVRQGHACLAQAAGAVSPGERYATAHLAALRAGAAVLAARARPVASGGPRRGRGPRNVWVVLIEVAPELSEWAEFFAAGAGKRAAAEAGLPRAVSAREADDLVREAEAFLELVCVLLGVSRQRTVLAGLAAG